MENISCLACRLLRRALTSCGLFSFTQESTELISLGLLSEFLCPGLPNCFAFLPGRKPQRLVFYGFSTLF